MRATENHPNRPERPSDDLGRLLRRRLAEDPIVDDTTLAVSADGGTVTLAGEVQDKDTFQHIVDVVRRLDASADIDNLMTIAPQAQGKDHDVVQELRKKLDDDFPSSDVEVTLVGSTAVLEGTASHDAVRSEIERMVQGHARVDRTVNHIRVL